MIKKEIILEKDIMIVSETDKKGNIIFANSDFCNIAGYKREELVGKPHNIVRHEDMPKVAFKDLWKTLQTGKIWNGIVKNKTKDGNFYWVNATAFSSGKPDGELRYISVRVKPTLKEIEDAKELYERLN